jgi:gas vesicle protein
MNEHTQEHRDYTFMIGLLTGAVVGAGLALWLAPRSASEIRERVTDTARRLGKRASDEYQHASARIVETVDEITRKGQHVRDNVADVVERGAHEVERFAAAAKTDHVAETRKHSAAGRPT